MGAAAIRAGIDIGGTFTDVAIEHPDGLATCKVLTDQAEPEAAILEGIETAARRAGLAPGSIGQVIHGTTLVTNALIERRGARTAFITTEGFRDVIETRSENRFEQYDLNIELPKPLIARRHRLTVAERIAADGEILLPLEDSKVSRMVGTVRAGGFEAVAVGFLHSYANDRHERKMAEALKAAMPELSVSLSSVVSPQMRELPRFNTVIANAFVQPRMAAYLGRLTEVLREIGVDAPVFMLHSGGGLISVETAIEQPVRLLESGPAGGAIYAGGFAKSHGIGRALSFDMGGTTAKICLVEDGSPKTASTLEVARTHRFSKGSGMLISTPVVEMVEIGAGGGSIASIDAMGRIRVGPRSAGSQPGPACYRRGGTEPTVTDSDLMLGRLDPNNFSGGAIELDPALAHGSIDQHVGKRIGLSVHDAAFGVGEIVDENMANAARVHAVEKGRDIGQFTMIAFGGGAPLHACRLCEKLGIDAMLVPPGAGVGSAIGFLRAPFSYEAGRGHYQSLESFDADAANATINSMEREAGDFVRMGAGDAPTKGHLTAFMRYSGQGWEIPVPLERRRFTRGSVPEIQAAFESAYRTRFGRAIEGLSVEITNWSLTVATEAPQLQPVAAATEGTAAPVERERDMFDAALRTTVSAAEVLRGDLGPGRCADGPAIIVEDETSTIVTSAFRAVGQRDGSILLLRKGAGR